MWRRKKLIVIGLISAVLLVGSIGGVAFAQTESGADSRPAVPCGAVIDRVCEIYEENTGVAIEPEALEDAFAQARIEDRQELMESRIQNLVEQGEMTQEQADQYLEWWQSKPDVSPAFGFKGHGDFRGGGGMFRGGMRGPCFPVEEE